MIGLLYIFPRGAVSCERQALLPLTVQSSMEKCKPVVLPEVLSSTLGFKWKLNPLLL